MGERKESAAKVRRARGRAEPGPQAAEVVAPRGGGGREAEAEQVGAPREGEYVVHLPSFEGPLDLLLHLIQKHELDILDIPVSFITEKYLEYLRVMQSLTIDLASEYLVMAATLTHIKSKMLLPVVPAGQDDDGMPGEEEDPRAELVRRLLEYQKYKAAAEELSDRGTLGRDVFVRGMSEDEIPQGPAPFAQTGVFNLLDAFEQILKRTKVKIDHEVVFDRISITDRIVELTEKLSVRKAMTFEELLLDGHPRGVPIPKFELIITFLAMLEMAKLKLIRVHQTDPLAPIHLELTAQGTAAADDGDPYGVEAARREPGGDAPRAAGAAAQDAEDGALEAIADDEPDLADDEPDLADDEPDLADGDADADDLLDPGAGPDLDMDDEGLDGDG